MSRFTHSLRWLLLPVLALAVWPAPPAAAAVAVFTRPTDAAVLDPFRLPNGPYAAGNRGIEYDAGAGAAVVAAADGTVAFAGAVAGNLFVSVEHPGGLRTTYGFVENILIRRGDLVSRGERVALAGGPFHFTVRLHGTYVDPEPLFGQRRVRVRLLPHHSSDGGREAIPAHAVPAGLGIAPDTLFDGPFGPRTSPFWDRRNHWVRALPGRLGVPHEHETGKEGNHGCHLHEAAARGWCALRSPDPPLEPQDEAVHPR
ncbi:MAG: M23 family metallopeptidase [Acidimicrobiales bacterium]|jgi:hypothetical protein|nr:M23 family metallopeptidase [Acidimicrobiales bacterium]